MATTSAGILMYHGNDDGIDVLLVHPGGPYWSKRDLGAWSIPTEELDDKEAAENAARREFAEELGVPVRGPLQPIGCVRQRGLVCESCAIVAVECRRRLVGLRFGARVLCFRDLSTAVH